MAGNALEFFIRARDEASAALGRVHGNVTSLGGALRALSGGAGVIGLIGTAAVGAVSGIVAAGAAIADTVEQLDRLAARTGVGIERLQVWRKVIEDGGGSGEALAGALGFLNRAIATNNPLLAQLGITTKDTEEAFTQLVGILAQSDDTAKKTEVTYRLLGRGAADLIAHFEDLAFKSAEYEARLRSTGSLITEQTAPAIRELDSELDELNTTWKGITTWFQIGAAKMATPVIRAINDIAEAARNAITMLDHVFHPGKLRASAFARGAGAFAPAPPPGAKAPPSDPLARINLDLEAERMATRHGRSRLREVPELPPLQGSVFADRELLLKNLAESQAKANAEVERFIDNMIAEQAAIGDVEEAIHAWQRALDDVLSTTQVTTDLVGATFRGLEAGLSATFAQITARWEYSANIINNITHALVDSLLQEFARLAAAQALNSLLPGLGTVVGFFTGGASGGGGAAGQPGTGSPRGLDTPRAAITINVSAMDAESIERSLTSPDGSLRQAFAEVGLRAPRR